MTTRKSFLASGAALAALAPPAAMASPSPAASASPPGGAIPQAAPSATPSPEPSFPPLKFQLSAFEAALKTAAPHRHMFAATHIAGGQVFGAMRGVLDAYADIGVPAKDVHPVAVLYHGGSVYLGFDDAMWNEYFIPLQPKGNLNLNDYAKDFNTVYDAGTHGNPCLPKSGGDSSIESLVADAGAHYFVCNNATKGFATYIARYLKKDPVDVYATLAAHLVPNAMLVPAGIWAVHAIQERGYTYLQDNL